MSDYEFIPDWYIEEPDERKGLRNISKIRKVSEETLDRTTY